jgi:hypothetical protein
MPASDGSQGPIARQKDGSGELGYALRGSARVDQERGVDIPAQDQIVGEAWTRGVIRK